MTIPIFERQVKNRRNYFAVTNPSMIMDSNELEEFLTFEEMIKVCTLNDWIIKY